MRKENNFIIRLSTINYRLSTKGLTLIEVMIVVAILAVISSTLFSVFQSSLFSQRKGTNKAIIYSEARAALDMMSREIEKAFVDERNGAECWGLDGTGGNPDTFLFIAPLNPDADIKSPKADYYQAELCEVGYWMTNEELMRGWTTRTNDFDFDSNNDSVFDVSDLGSTASLIGSVSNLQFEYFDGQQWTTIYANPGDWDDAGNPTLVLPRAIKITLVMAYESEKDDIRHDTFITIVNIPGSGQ
ncbi:MAG: GspJ family type II secretion system protein [Candidatus Omnitrophica bacterium]|nr:GspJ family type II secretion system protein [Candidatus Omnitrophota bacterium]MBU1048351.1 GspJ family type II secretion system protein [Candidatus Omnitrophota bacterium]MBU1889667.1 GspJ family type II secretion system protein [Candidatus Omnitrophota bacterium]